MTQSIKTNAGRLALAALAAVVAVQLVLLSPHAQIIKKAAGISGSDKTGIASAASAIMSPALIALAAITPLACVAGFAALSFGNKKGMTLIVSSIGALIGAGAITGIIA